MEYQNILYWSILMVMQNLTSHIEEPRRALKAFSEMNCTMETPKVPLMKCYLKKEEYWEQKVQVISPGTEPRHTICTENLNSRKFWIHLAVTVPVFVTHVTCCTSLWSSARVLKTNFCSECYMCTRANGCSVQWAESATRCLDLYSYQKEYQNYHYFLSSLCTLNHKIAAVKAVGTDRGKNLP